MMAVPPPLGVGIHGFWGPVGSQLSLFWENVELILWLSCSTVFVGLFVKDTDFLCYQADSVALHRQFDYFFFLLKK